MLQFINFSDDMTLEYTANYELENRDGVEYMKITDTSMVFEPTSIRYRLKNLYDGNKKLCKH